MKKTIIKSAKSKQKAINDALKEINKKEEEVEIQVLEKESNGFLGLIGQKDAIVKITYEENFEEGFKNLKEELKHEEDLLGIKEDDFEQKKEEVVEEEKEDVILFDEDTNTDSNQNLNDKDDTLKEEVDQQAINVEKYYRAKDFLKQILESMHFENVKVIGNLENNIIKLDAKIDEKDTGIAIGRSAKTLEAIELIMRKSLNVRMNDLKLSIDINNYKKRRDDKIRQQADYAAEKVQKTRKRWNLRYMNAYERRLAHERISKYSNLTSYSEGQEPKRFVVVDLIENK